MSNLLFFIANRFALKLPTTYHSGYSLHSLLDTIVPFLVLMIHLEVSVSYGIEWMVIDADDAK